MNNDSDCYFWKKPMVSIITISRIILIPNNNFNNVLYYLTPALVLRHFIISCKWNYKILRQNFNIVKISLITNKLQQQRNVTHQRIIKYILCCSYFCGVKSLFVSVKTGHSLENAYKNNRSIYNWCGYENVQWKWRHVETPSSGSMH